MVYADLDQDLQETWAVQGVYPDSGLGPPDSNSIIFSGGRQDPAGQPPGTTDRGAAKEIR